MTRSRLTVVLSQAQGKHPQKRALEESLVAALIMESGLDVSVVPHLYDITPDHTARLFLDSVHGDLVVLSWLFPRAAFWVLDRDGIKGIWGESPLHPATGDEEENAEPQPPKGIGALDVPNRHLYCLDLRERQSHDDFVAEIRRIAAECQARRVSQVQPKIVELGMGMLNETKPRFTPEQLLKTPGRRWYPVIDYSRCTNCLECLDFCLFGVYGIDGQERILVENQDNCKKGCPACSRVCPEQAIMFPDYKTAAIAGAPVGNIADLKIDLSRLFGGDVKDPLAQAVAERDRELVADGREAVGVAVGLPKRQGDKPSAPKDDLDNLMDQLDALDL